MCFSQRIVWDACIGKSKIICQAESCFELRSLCSHGETVRSTSKYLGLQSNGILHRVIR